MPCGHPRRYRASFWDLMRTKNPTPQVVDALRIGADTEGGYLVPDEYERTLVEALEEENIFRSLAHRPRHQHRQWGAENPRGVLQGDR